MTFLDALQTLADDPTAPLDIAEVALLLATDEYPHLDYDLYTRRIDDLASAVSSLSADDLESRTAEFASVLFEKEGFAGNSGDYYDPRNSYLNHVIDRRLGIPISLSVLAMAVGQRAGLQVEGIGLP